MEREGEAKTMNWKVIVELSLFGLAMGLGTVFLIPSRIEPLFWVVVFVISAYTIAGRCRGRYFLHGMLVGLANCVWVTGAHVLLFDRYIANHPEEAAMVASSPMADSPRMMMLLVGPVIGLVSGVLIGILATIAARLRARRDPAGPLK